MTAMLDLGPAAQRLADLLSAIPDEQLTAPTPCAKYTLGDLLDHVDGLSHAFLIAARKTPLSEGSQPPSPDASRLGADWRTRIPEQLTTLAEAWRDPAAWEGMTEVGGVTMPAGMIGRVGLNELTIHGWDIARATGQPFSADVQTLEGCREFVEPLAAPGQSPARQGIFGPAVAIPSDAPLLDRIVALTGRDPAWAAA
ncbi:TIGR03086 family protein [Streptomyces sp. So13.3]|uniref:TIGR03086 family metal-binding protein n=1 Tax=Streptomyces TaxID=1883 RepID=UPI001105F001|nr:MULTISPECIES: TIGR03086 family metal-binding protein [Streptomyces]MCZ4099998.1 TIGR03086 family metal-binding protein [Streptomyces sp. H39-C1]QNA76991.1 TIGR03086 family protein [Streptomyces sp. So13.3]